MNQDISILKGCTITEINKTDDEILFTLDNGKQYRMYHEQDCCEGVYIDDIDGELGDLLSTPILQAEEVSTTDIPAPKNADSYTWTFYKFATIRGYVTIKWLGQSNGYYSEGVSFCEID